MAKDRRTDRKPIPNDVNKILSGNQLATLREVEYFGWRLKFVRRPLFQEPVPVVYNARSGIIGILDTDGQINLELELEARSRECGQERQPSKSASWKEKRKGVAPIPEDLDELLTQIQLQTLRKIKKFGWQLHFVRQPLFEEPLPVIISSKGDKMATLEQDGRIKLIPHSAIRKDAPPAPASKSKQAG